MTATLSRLLVQGEENVLHSMSCGSIMTDQMHATWKYQTGFLAGEAALNCD